MRKPKKIHKSFCKDRSLSKMIVYLKDGSVTTRYSFLAADKKGFKIGIQRFEKMLNHPVNAHRWKTAVVYDNQNRSRPEVEKFKDQLKWCPATEKYISF